MTLRRAALITGTGVVLACSAASAHELIMRYDLPVPFNLYMYACAATVVATFVLAAVFMRATQTGVAAGVRDGATPGRSIARLPGTVVALARWCAVALLLLTVGIALFGTRDPDRNLSLTMFWQIFLLGFTYLTALIGDLYSIVNPWKAIADWFAARLPRRTPVATYPARVAYWPAVIMYIALVWLELFASPRPRGLAVALIAYGMITFAGVYAFGSTPWFRYADPFAVLLRLVAKLAPIEYGTDSSGRSVVVTLRMPFVATLRESADDMSLVVFVLLILASTTYDGIHQTIFWMGLFYKNLLALSQPLWGGDLLASQAKIEPWFVAYQRAGLVLAPFFYLAIYLGVLACVKASTRTSMTVAQLARAFAFSIIPIAFVYNVAHYYTLVLTRAMALPYLFTDPFARGWDLFGVGAMGEPPTLNIAAVWHTEVALIVLGHIVSVYLAHRLSLRLFPTHRAAVVSEIPMLVLMTAYTVIGLWVISLPFALT